MVLDEKHMLSADATALGSGPTATAFKTPASNAHLTVAGAGVLANDNPPSSPLIAAFEPSPGSHSSKRSRAHGDAMRHMLQAASAPLRTSFAVRAPL